jgi:oligopeptide/dipeptide ABC transporter ATP-binding protein
MAAGDVIIKARGLTKHFELKKGFLSFGGPTPVVKAVDGVDFDMRSGEILGLVGESGCGKTTVGRLLTRLEDPTDGYVFFLGRDIALLEGQDVKVFRRNIQMVFQDPYESLNPRTTVLQTIMEPLLNHHVGETQEERVEMAVRSLEDSGLAPAKEYLNRFPHELSGGQRQRVAVARSLAVKPRVIVADEPVSMLDVSIRAGVLNLMLDLRDKYGIPYLFITHDIAVARYVSDRLAVMYLGRVVELADSEVAISEPKHPYTQALLSAVPVPDPDAKHGRIKIKGEVPSASNVPLGCRFRPRCPKAFKDCGWQAADMVEWLGAEGHLKEGAPLATAIDGLDPGGFILQMRLKDDANPVSVINTVEGVIEKAKAEHPMAHAVEAVDSVLTDRYVEVKCRSTTITSEELACELLALLESTVTYKEADHPMHGIISDMRQDGNRLRIFVGKGDQNAKIVEAFVQDYVRHHRKRNRPEFKGVRSISSDRVGGVTVVCRDAKEPAREVAKDVALHVEKCAAADERLFRRLFPVEVRRGKARIRVMGTEEDWKRLESALRAYFSPESKAEENLGRMVSSIKVKRAKGAKNVVAVRFIKSKDPPLYDTGGGHMVACLLYRDEERAPSSVQVGGKVSSDDHKG